MGCMCRQITSCEAVCTRVLAEARKCLHKESVVKELTPKGFRGLQRKMQALEEQMYRGINLLLRDEREDVAKVEENVEVEVVLNLEEERLFRAISKIGKRPKFKVPTFLGNLNLEELINCINKLKEYFEYEDIEYHDRVKFAKEKLKGHVKIWW